MVLCILLPVLSWAKDSFGRIKKGLSNSECSRFEFVNIVKSTVFDQVDSVYGSILIASDGQYDLALGNDRYTRNNKYLYSYSEENNQVVIEKSSPETDANEQLTFITRIDEFYNTFTVKKDSLYRLIRKDNITSDVPDSLKLIIESDVMRIKQISYYDINEELNTIVIMRQETDLSCDSSHFTPSFPDSVETVRF